MATAHERATELSPGWRRALSEFDRAQEARSVSANTRRAYATDLTEFARWATERGLEADAIAYRELRGYAAALSDRGLARSTVARKLAAIRSLYAHLVTTGEAPGNPAELLPSPKRDSRLPRVLGREEMETLLARIPAGSPLTTRPGDVRARLLVRASVR